MNAYYGLVCILNYFIKMLSKEVKEGMEKQQYRIVGDHSAVKICGWTKKSIKDEGECYKYKFYGIDSSKCLQMTPSVICANRCLFCWRDYKAPISKEWKWGVDEPLKILEGCIKAHNKLLEGIKGYEKVNLEKYEGSKNIKHVALSLTGEALAYPKIDELIKEFHKKKISTFLVTNAQFPEKIKKLSPITQLYISLDSPTKELMKEVSVSLFSDYWERLNESLEILKGKNRTALRITLMKGINMEKVEEFIPLIEKSEPDFIEVKSYMFIGASRERMKKENMPLHEDVVDFSKKLEGILSDYEIVSEKISSRVVMLAHKKFKKNNEWFTWIDFENFFELVEIGEEFNSEDYMKKMPDEFVGLSGKGTKDRVDAKYRHQ
jgi:tRNA wybutosine-synthesizing protein 1